tara:strand:- start:1691 stop:2020 length:330 start_codon:yes stop_codon:yes gene_type:complete
MRNLHITEFRLKALGYTKHTCDYWCAPPPAHGGTYRIDFRATVWLNMSTPKKGTEEWRAYLPINADPYDDTSSSMPTIRRFKTLGELADFHKGMCGGSLPLTKIITDEK